MWVEARQYTGRIVTVSNSQIFDQPVYNYTRDFPYLWDEMRIPITYRVDRAPAAPVRLGLGNATVSYDALEAALQFDVEEIYFLTDGAPHGGRITSPPAIVKMITQTNMYRRMTINSIGIGVGHPGNPFDSFLSTLAQHNFGEYQRVDQ